MTRCLIGYFGGLDVPLEYIVIRIDLECVDGQLNHHKSFQRLSIYSRSSPEAGIVDDIFRTEGRSE